MAGVDRCPGEAGVEVAPKDSFLASLERCQRVGNFLLRFYARFTDSSEEIRHRFRLTDFRRQMRMLGESLRLCALAIRGDRQGLVELNERALTHDRHHHNAKPEWYQLWLDALVETAAQTDPLWSEELEATWRRELGYVIHHMQSRY